jgi:hypothetical protein
MNGTPISILAAPLAGGIDFEGATAGKPDGYRGCVRKRWGELPGGIDHEGATAGKPDCHRACV